MPAELKYVPIAPHGDGSVHSVYRSTVNFTIGGKLFSLQDSKAECTPISFVLNEKESLPLCRVGESTLWDGTRVKIGDTTFVGAKKTKCFEGKLPNASHPAFSPVFALPECHGVFGGDHRIAGEAAGIIKRTQLAIARQEWENAADAMENMIGLGCGLTPSGDDWLTGTMAFLHFSETIDDSCAQLLEALRLAILPRLSKTNDISARFLELACKGLFSAPICALFSAWQEEKEAAFAEAVARILRLGHSSGADVLNGIRFIYKCFI